MNIIDKPCRLEYMATRHISVNIALCMFLGNRMSA